MQQSSASAAVSANSTLPHPQVGLRSYFGELSAGHPLLVFLAFLLRSVQCECVGVRIEFEIIIQSVVTRSPQCIANSLKLLLTVLATSLSGGRTFSSFLPIRSPFLPAPTCAPGGATNACRVLCCLNPLLMS